MTPGRETERYITHGDTKEKKTLRKRDTKKKEEENAATRGEEREIKVSSWGLITAAFPHIKARRERRKDCSHSLTASHLAEDGHSARVSSTVVGRLLSPCMRGEDALLSNFEPIRSTLLQGCLET